MRLVNCSLCVLRGRRQGSYYDLDTYNRKECVLILSRIPLIMALSDSDNHRRLITDLHTGCSSHWHIIKDGARVPSGIKNLKRLKVLEIVDIAVTDSRAIQELGELNQLRKLSVMTKGSNKKKCKILCAAIEKLTSFKSLYVDGHGYSLDGTLEWLDSISHPPSLKSLRLKGCIKETPNWFRELKHLVKIYLYKSRLNGDTMEILGELHNLMDLHFRWYAYVGEKLVFIEGAFQNLRKLVVETEDKLREVRFEEGTSPQMEWIEICHCELISGIVGVKHLPRLKEIGLKSAKVARLGQLEGEVDTHPNQPILRLSEKRSYHDLGETHVSAVEVEVADEPLAHQQPVDVDDRTTTGQSCIMTFMQLLVLFFSFVQH